CARQGIYDGYYYFDYW
nr:immunoglobulin heavy chain junction region [Mus musculus]NSM03976.1 immunoglobulin heavy chain junction region [Mus musculus]NSM04173.1 immunoglobulin heavy chain junction region [Mus musculus]NSM04249.1 immunoglobulin heavy chain junction region [Mus musculus]NSM04352.1 immunoglobulin heavy chain junction region [Mus musculus]